MGHTLLLVHPPLLGPGAWRPVARVLAAGGHVVHVPDLRAATGRADRWWERAADTAAAAAGAGPVVVVGFSGAGVLLPAVTVRLPAARSVVLVDAVVPSQVGDTAPAERLRSFVDGLPTEDGLLPRWSRWWPAEELAQLLPDPAQRAALEAEQPRLPRAFYDVAVPAPAGWADRPVAYLRLSPAYEGDAVEAAGRGWPVERVEGDHLLPVTRPADVAERIVRLAG